MLAVLLPLCVDDLARRAGEAARPELSGPEHTIPSADGVFLLHYTLEGGDAPGGELADDGVPLLVHRALDGLATGVAAFEARGWRALTSDAVGDAAIDVYLRALDINGYAHPAAAGEGGSGSSCFLELDNQLTLSGVMESVAIHELHHCVEFRYTTATSGWIYEATATYEQYLTYLDATLEAAVVVLYSWRLGQPELPLDHRDGDYEYAGFVFVQFWEQLGGADPARLDDLWTALEVDPDWPSALEAAAGAAWGWSLAEAFLEYSTWNFFACAHDDGQHYTADALPCGDAVTVPFEEVEPAPSTWTTRLGDGRYTASYAELPAPEHGLIATCDVARDPADLRVRLVEVGADGRSGATSDGAAGEPIALGGHLDAGGTVRVVLASVGETAPGRVSCTFEADEPLAEAPPAAGCGCATRPGPGGGVFWLALSAVAAGGRRSGARLRRALAGPDRREPVARRLQTT